MKGFSNPLVFDEKEMRRSNILKKELEDAYGVRVQTMLQRVHDQGFPYRCEDVLWQPAG